MHWAKSEAALRCSSCFSTILRWREGPKAPTTATNDAAIEVEVAPSEGPIIPDRAEDPPAEVEEEVAGAIEVKPLPAGDSPEEFGYRSPEDMFKGLLHMQCPRGCAWSAS